MQCIRACLQACRKNAPSPGFSRRCFPLCQPDKTTFGEPVPPDLSPVATLLLRAPRESTLDELHGAFSRTQDVFSRAPLRARSRPSQRLKPILFRNGSARLKACPDTKPVKPKRAPKCRNSRDRLSTVPAPDQVPIWRLAFPGGAEGRPKRACYRDYFASTTQRKPSAPARSLDGAISRYLPCVLSLYPCGKYHIEPCGWK